VGIVIGPYDVLVEASVALTPEKIAECRSRALTVDVRSSAMCNHVIAIYTPEINAETGHSRRIANALMQLGP
jgi:hypothetical protein